MAESWDMFTREFFMHSRSWKPDNTGSRVKGRLMSLSISEKGMRKQIRKYPDVIKRLNSAGLTQGFLADTGKQRYVTAQNNPESIFRHQKTSCHHREVIRRQHLLLGSALGF